MKVRTMRHPRFTVLAGALLCALFLLPSEDALSQKRPASLREFLSGYKGKEIQILDKTGGTEQFAGGDASRAYTLTLNDVLSDYIIVSRNTSTDKRTFIYPLSVIRRVIFQYDGRPYDRILLEMY